MEYTDNNCSGSIQTQQTVVMILSLISFIWLPPTYHLPPTYLPTKLISTDYLCSKLPAARGAPLLWFERRTLTYPRWQGFGLH